MGPKGKRQLGNNPLFSKILNILFRSEKKSKAQGLYGSSVSGWPTGGGDPGAEIGSEVKD